MRLLLVVFSLFMTSVSVQAATGLQCDSYSLLLNLPQYSENKKNTVVGDSVFYGKKPQAVVVKTTESGLTIKVDLNGNGKWEAIGRMDKQDNPDFGLAEDEGVMTDVAVLYVGALSVYTTPGEVSEESLTCYFTN